MKWLKWGILAAVLAAVWLGLNQANLQEHLKGVLGWVRDQGAWAPVLFILVYATATVLLLPGFILTIGSGFIFGVGKGFLYSLIGANLGAAAAFLFGRYLARNRVRAKFGQNKTFTAIDGAVAEGGWKVVGLLRLSPVVPYNVLNYSLGLTRVSLKEYVVASAVGMLPGTLLYVWIGSLAGDLATLGSGDRERTPLEWTFYGLGLVATLVVTVLITRRARQRLRQQTEISTDEGSSDQKAAGEAAG